MFDGYGANTVTVQDCTFLDNTGDAALSILTMPQSTVSHNVFQGNASPMNATALVVNGSGDAHMALDDNLFLLNDASQFRGVILWHASGEVLRNTFWSNQSQPGRAVLYDTSPAGVSVIIANNIFAESSGGAGCKAVFAPPQGAQQRVHEQVRW